MLRVLGRLMGGGGLLFGAEGSAARWGRRKMRRLDRRSDQEAFLKAWLTLRVTRLDTFPGHLLPQRRQLLDLVR